MDGELYNYKPARRAHSRVGLAMTVIILAASVGQVLWVLIPSEDSWMVASSWGFWLGSFLPLYVLAMPLGFLILKTLPAQAPEEHKLPGSALYVLIPVMLFFTISGNLVGTGLSGILSNGNAENAVETYASDSNPIKIVFLVILAPILEELLCRKLIIDRTRQYGEKLAVVFSGFVFGVFHQNFFQFFYAFTLGMLLAYVYIRTGRLRYCILLHGGLNLWGGIIPSLFQPLLDSEAYQIVLEGTASEAEFLAAYQEIQLAVALSNMYSMATIGLAIVGAVLLFIKRKELVWKDAECELPDRRIRTAYLNVGMIVYILLCAGSFVLALM